MAISPYTQAAEAPIIDTYIPIPFAEIAQAGATRQARYEEGLAHEEALQTELGNIQALSQIPLPGLGGAVAVNERKAVDQITSDYMAQIDELASTIPDKSSPEHRAKIRNLLRNFRKDAAPNGRLGIAQSNVKALQDFQKRLDENPQLQANPHLLAPFIQRIQQHALASQRDGSIRPLNLSGAIGEGINIHEEMGSILKQIGSSVLSPEEITAVGDNIPGLLKLVTEKGVDPQRIANVAAGLIKRNPAIANDISMQAQFAQQRGAEGITPESIATGYIQDAIQTYTQLDRNVKTMFQPGTGAAEAARRAKLNRDFSAQVVTFLPGTGIKDMSELAMAKTKAAEGIQAAKDDYDLYLRKVGIMDEAGNVQKNADGSINYRVKDPITGLDRDYSDLAAPRILAIANAEKKARAWEQLEADARKEVGYTPEYERSPEHQARLKQATEEAQRTMRALTNARAFPTTITHEDWMEREIHRNLIELGDDRAKRLDEELARRAEDGTYTAGLTTVGTTLTGQLEDQFINNFPSFKLATGSIKSMDPEKQGRELTEDDFDDLSINEKNKPRFMGFFFDDAEQGKLKLAYAVKDEDGNIVDRVKIDAYAGMEQDLIAEGAIDEAKSVINQRLVGELGALGRFGSTDTFTFGEGPNALNMTVRDKNNTSGQYIVEVPAQDPLTGETVLKPTPFNDKLQMINWMADKIALYYSKQLK